MQMPGDFPLSNPLDSWGIWILALCVGVVYGIRSYFGGPECRSRRSMKGKIAVVVGASSGSIGEQVAIDLAQRGAKVIIGSLCPEKGARLAQSIRKHAASETVRCSPIDLLSFDSISAFVDNITHDKVDVLVCCAGTFMPPFSYSEQGFESQFQINFLGQFFLAHSLLPRLRAAAAASADKEARVIFVTCRVFTLAEKLDLSTVRGEEILSEQDNRSGSYTRSKVALTMAALEAARRWKDDGVNVILAHPGVVNSNHGRHLPLFANSLFKLSFYPFFWLFTKTPWHGAQTVIFCAVAEALKGVTGKYYVDTYETTIEGFVANEYAAKKVFDRAVDWIEKEKEKNENDEEE